jgi:uncharacterized protein (DUF1697 family)
MPDSQVNRVLVLFFKKELLPFFLQMDRYVALLRGVNVGRGNRIAMADLRAAAAALGYTDPRTLLNSGNLLFSAPPAAAAKADTDLAAALLRHGVNARVFVVSVARLRRIVAANPVAGIATDPARLLVAVFAGGVAEPVAALVGEDWSPDAFAIAEGAGFLWCAGGILQSRLGKAFARVAGDATTSRNFATMLKLAA